VAHQKQAITGDTTVTDLINHAITNGAQFVVNHNGYEIAVTKV
jgi:sulfur carrier protein ThiS